MKMLQGKRKLILEASLPTAGSLCQQEAMWEPVQLPQALPSKGIVLANRPSWEHWTGLLFLLYRGAKPALDTALGARGTQPVLAPHTPHSLLPLLLTPPWGQGELQALLWLCPKQNNFIGQGSLVRALEQEQGAREQAPMELERGAGKDLWALGVSCLFLLKPGAKFIPHVAATQPGMNVTHFAAFVSPCQKGDTV